MCLSGYNTHKCFEKPMPIFIVVQDTNYIRSRRKTFNDSVLDYVITYQQRLPH